MQIRFTDKKKKRRKKYPCAKYKRHKNEQNPKSAESVNAAVAESGSACDAASLGFGFSFLLFSVLRGVCLARRSEATPTCIKTSTRHSANSINLVHLLSVDLLCSLNYNNNITSYKETTLYGYN